MIRINVIKREVISAEYWAYELYRSDPVKPLTRVFWTHSIQDICQRWKLTRARLATLVATGRGRPTSMIGSCVECGTPLVFLPTATNRDDFEWQWKVFNPRQCYRCLRRAEESAAAERREKLAAKQAAENEARRIREEKRLAAVAKYGERVVRPCDRCGEWLVMRLASGGHACIWCPACEHVEWFDSDAEEIRAIEILERDFERRMMAKKEG